MRPESRFRFLFLLLLNVYTYGKLDFLRYWENLCSPSKKAHPGIYVLIGMHTHLCNPQLFPAAILCLCHGHTIQSPYLQRHCQIFSFIPGKSDLVQSEHHHFLILTLILLPIFSFCRRIHSANQSIFKRSLIQEVEQLLPYPE